MKTTSPTAQGAYTTVKMACTTVQDVSPTMKTASPTTPIPNLPSPSLVFSLRN